MKNKIEIEYIEDTKFIRHEFQIEYFDQPFTVYIFTKENGEINEFKMYDDNDFEDNDTTNDYTNAYLATTMPLDHNSYTDNEFLRYETVYQSPSPVALTLVDSQNATAIVEGYDLRLVVFHEIAHAIEQEIELLQRRALIRADDEAFLQALLQLDSI